MNIYYDEDTDIETLKDRKIAIIGYGIQGRAQALNLRDSGCDVIIGNIKDLYYERAKLDGFEVVSPAKATKEGSIILVLIPDQAQKTIYEEHLCANLEKGNMLIFAHGYSIHFKEIIPPENIDVCLLAPRMPGKQIREYFLRGGGVPVYVAVHQNATGKAKEVVLALAKAMGFTKAGAMELSFKEETELDLFVEQFFLPIIIKALRLSFDTLIEEGYTPEASLMELYASGEIGELLMMASKRGIYGVWKENASPTCQYGIFRNSKLVLPEDNTKKMIKKIIKEIKDGSFVKDLSEEGRNNYQNLKKYNEENENSLITTIQDRLLKIIKYRSTENNE